MNENVRGNTSSSTDQKNVSNSGTKSEIEQVRQDFRKLGAGEAKRLHPEFGSMIEQWEQEGETSRTSG